MRPASSARPPAAAARANAAASTASIRERLIRPIIDARAAKAQACRPPRKMEAGPRSIPGQPAFAGAAAHLASVPTDETRRNRVPDRMERFSALAGVPAVVLWATGVLVAGGGHLGLPGGVPEESAADVLAHFRENADAAVSGGWLFMLGSLAFLWFVGILRGRLHAAEGANATFTSIAFAGGVATGVFALGLPTGGVVAGLGVDQLGASEAAALNALETAFFIGAELAAVVLLAAGAVVALRTGVLPRWWAVLSILLAVWLVIGPIGWIGLLAGLPLWTVLTSLLLVGAGARAPVAASVHR